MVDYFKIIHKYITPTSLAYRFYIPHVAMVTHKALQIARRLNLSEAQRRFIEEAAMLHDIGIIKVQATEIGCTGDLPYICHLTTGREILEQEGLPRHALVAERHAGVGINRQEIIERGLPLPPRDMLPESLEEKIISWADLFYNKISGEVWVEQPVATVRQRLAEFGQDKLDTFDAWRALFEG